MAAFNNERLTFAAYAVAKVFENRRATARTSAERTDTKDERHKDRAQNTSYAYVSRLVNITDTQKQTITLGPAS